MLFIVVNAVYSGQAISRICHSNLNEANTVKYRLKFIEDVLILRFNFCSV